MKHILVCIMLLTSWFTFAQTQSGFVKTLGRPDKPGMALSGVSIRVKGEHNAVLSKSDGTFSVLMSGKKNGDAYALQQVQKTGYELNEVGVIGRQYAFSDKVPLKIVMVSTAKLQVDKQRIENNAYQVAEKNYKAKLAHLEKQRDDNAITIEEYRQQLQELQDKFEKYQSLIDGLAEHYAHVDYDNLDEKEREINICIENGALERADSLIHSLFDSTDVLKRNKDAIAKIEQQESQAHEILAQANADMGRVLKQQEKDAEYLYQLYTIAIGKFEFDRAGQYIESRAALDTTNTLWQFDTAKYFQDQKLYNKAEQYYLQTLKLYKHIVKDNMEGNEYNVAVTLNNLANLYSVTRRFTEGETMYKEALVIYRQLAQTNLQTYEPNVALTLNNLALLYSDTQRFTESEAMYKEVLEIRRRLALPIRKHTSLMWLGRWTIWRPCTQTSNVLRRVRRCTRRHLKYIAAWYSPMSKPTSLIWRGR